MISRAMEQELVTQLKKISVVTVLGRVRQGRPPWFGRSCLITIM